MITDTKQSRVCIFRDAVFKLPSFSVNLNLRSLSMFSLILVRVPLRVLKSVFEHTDIISTGLLEGP